MRITRLAPSPTGALHLGNARTFLVNWLLARRNGWRILLRIEDLDSPRVKPDSANQTLDDLHWLGLDADTAPTYQSRQLDRYPPYLARLLTDKFAYPCICTRREIELAASAPHADDGATPYPGTCRNRFASLADAGPNPAIRFRVPDEPVIFTDQFAGPQQIDVSKLGDFVIARPSRDFPPLPVLGERVGVRGSSLRNPERPSPQSSPGVPGEEEIRPNTLPLSNTLPAYQLAVVIDDALSDVTDVIRGDDLLESAARQILLHRALAWSDKIPTYTHLPLILGPDGRRLAKRHGDTRLSTYRARGVPAARILALLARWCGMKTPDQTTLPDLLQDFSLDKIPPHPITFTPSDHAWLLNQERAA